MVTTETLIRSFWSSFKKEPMTAPTSLLYFYLIDRLQSNRWNPIVESDNDISKKLGIGRRLIPEYRETLKSRGLIDFHDTIQNQKVGKTYTLPRDIFSHDYYCSENNNDVQPTIARVEKTSDMSVFVEELKRSPQWIEAVCKNTRLSKEELPRWLDEYLLFCQCEGKEHTTLRDVKSHFSRWLPKRIENQKNKTTDESNRQNRSQRRRGSDTSAQSASDYSSTF